VRARARLVPDSLSTMSDSADERRARFRALHEREQLFVMPNPWDIGSARLLASAGFEALAPTSAGVCLV
jgi:2-methylisocitrate lyase-like PEP mutase family enzyme